MDYSIITMTSEHISRIALLEKECFSSPWSENALSEELNNINSHFLVAVSDEVLGYIGVQEICGEAYITNIAVFDKHRKSAITLYESEGFEIAGIRKNFYTDPIENGVIYTKYF